MAKNQPSKKVVRRGAYGFLKILCGLTIVVACLVVFVGGIQTGARTVTILYRCLFATGVIGITFGIVIKVLSSYEEIYGG